MGKKIVVASEPVVLFCEGSAENTGRSASKGSCWFLSTSDRFFVGQQSPERQQFYRQSVRVQQAGFGARW